MKNGLILLPFLCLFSLFSQAFIIFQIYKYSMTLDPSRCSLFHIDADENDGDKVKVIMRATYIYWCCFYLRHLEKSLAFLISVLLSAIPTTPSTVPGIYQTFYKYWWTKGNIIKILWSRHSYHINSSNFSLSWFLLINQETTWFSLQNHEGTQKLVVPGTTFKRMWMWGWKKENVLKMLLEFNSLSCSARWWTRNVALLMAMVSQKNAGLEGIGHGEACHLSV